MRRLAFLVPLTLFLPAFAAMLIGGAWTWFLPLYAFALLPVVEVFFKGSTDNATPEEEERLLADRVYDVMLWLVVPAQYALLVAFLWRTSTVDQPLWQLVGTVGTMAIACAAYGINAAHELGHRRTAHEQAMAKALLATTLYMHFFVEHNRGHHRRVATPDDPATSREGETLYAFWPRSVWGGIVSAWELEEARVSRLGQSPWSWSNEMVRYAVIQAALVVGIGVVFGPLALACFLVAATGGFLLLETINYVEHYGLVRARKGHGAYERVAPHHSWNSNRPAGRALLYELTRHADHHANATRPYQVLRHYDDAPQLPAGYPGMILLALFPPLFFRVMKPELAAWHARYDHDAAAAK